MNFEDVLILWHVFNNIALNTVRTGRIPTKLGLHHFLGIETLFNMHFDTSRLLLLVLQLFFELFLQGLLVARIFSKCMHMLKLCWEKEIERINSPCCPQLLSKSVGDTFFGHHLPAIAGRSQPKPPASRTKASACRCAAVRHPAHSAAWHLRPAAGLAGC